MHLASKPSLQAPHLVFYIMSSGNQAQVYIGLCGKHFTGGTIDPLDTPLQLKDPLLMGPSPTT